MRELFLMLVFVNVGLGFMNLAFGSADGLLWSACCALLCYGGWRTWP